MSDAVSNGSNKKSITFKIEPDVLPLDPTAMAGLEDHDWIVPVATPEPEEVDDDAKSRREVLRAELAAMTARDNNAKTRRLARRDEERRKAVAELQEERLRNGFTILPDTVKSKRVIQKAVQDEELIALKDKMEELKSEDANIQSEIDHKLGISALPKGDDLLALADDFYCKPHTHTDHLPEHIQRALTSEEVLDLRRVFELFDAKNKGFITAHDLKRMSAMLGLKAKQRVFKEMIDGTPSAKKGKINFLAFLDLVVKLQGDGADHYEEMKQFFNLLDKDRKGFVTFQDLRCAADELKLPLSNNAIRDMMSEADPRGDGRIQLESLVHVLGQSATFKSVMPSTPQ